MAIMPRKESYSGSQPEEARITVKDMLGIALLNDAKLIAGHAGQHRAITRVNVMESPDIVPWVKPGELLITSGQLLHEEPERFLQLLPELAVRGVSAIGISKGRFVREVPAEVAIEAEKLGLALLELPSELVFSDLVRACMEQVLAQETSQLTELQNRIQSMTRLLLDGSGLYAFLDALEEILGNPIVVVRELDKPWLSASLRGAEPTDVWPIMQSLAFRHVGRVARSGFALLQNAYRVYVSPIPSRHMKQACLVLLEKEKDIVPLDALSVDRLSSLVGMEMANVEAVREVEGKYLDQFLQDWLSGKIVSDADWKLRADVCGCAIPDGSHLCAALIGWQQKDPSPAQLRELTGRLRTERLRSLDGVLAALVGDELALVLPLGRSSTADDTEAFEQLLGRLLSELRPMLGDSELRLYAGRVTDRFDGLHASWSQARRARQVAEVCALPGELVTYDRLGVYSLLYLIPPGEEREQFLARFAVPLQQADRKGGGRLVETLEMFFRCNGNIKLTSERLFAHYNTIVYRLEKIQSILGVSLDDPEDRLQLHLALKLGQISPGTSG